MNTWRDTLEQARRDLRLHAMIAGGGAVLLLLVLVSMPRWTVLPTGIAPMALAASLVALGEALHLFFDAALLRLALSFDHETAGLDAIDRTLAGIGLRTLPDPAPSLDVRLSGTRSIRRRAYAALAIAVLLLVVVALVGEHGEIRC